MRPNISLRALVIGALIAAPIWTAFIVFVVKP